MKLQGIPNIQPIVDLSERISMIEQAVAINLEFFTAVETHAVEISQQQAKQLARQPDIEFDWQYGDSERGTLIVRAGF